MSRGIDERDNPARIAHMMAAEPQVLAAALGAFNALNSNNIPNSHDPGGIAEMNHDMRAFSRMQGTRRDMLAPITQQPQMVMDEQ
jgi:hypothetical protein